MMRSAIGVLTLICTPSGDDEMPEREWMEALRLLSRNTFSTELSFSAPPGCERAIREAAETLGNELISRGQAILIGCASAFMELARAYKRDVPDADILAILQRASLNLPTDSA